MGELNLGDNYGAITDYSKSIEIHPNNPVAFYNRGVIKFDLEKYYEAIADYTEAIQLNPNYAKAYHNIGVVKNKLKNYKSAIEDYLYQINVDPSKVSLVLLASPSPADKANWIENRIISLK